MMPCQRRTDDIVRQVHTFGSLGEKILIDIVIAFNIRLEDHIDLADIDSQVYDFTTINFHLSGKTKRIGPAFEFIPADLFRNRENIAGLMKMGGQNPVLTPVLKRMG